MSDTNEDLLNSKVIVEGENITLADLAGINLDDIAEKRGESLPKGFYVFEVSSENPPCLTVIGEGDKAKAAAKFEFNVIDVVTITDNEFTGDQTSLIGKKHGEIMMIGAGKSTIADSLGYIKAFLKDIGAPYVSNLNEQLAGAAGTRFTAPIGKRHNPDDKDIVYTNIVRGTKIKPLASATVSDVAKAVA